MGSWVKKVSTKIALITGASRGLGECFVRRFWNAGFTLCLVGRNKDSLKRISASLPHQNNQRIFLFDCDFSDIASVQSLPDSIKDQIQHMDVLINNAAIQGPIGPLWDNDVNEWKNTLQVNLFSPIILCRAFVPWMKETGGGSIINISGGGATSPRPNFSAYATAKSGLIRFSETLAVETKALGIRVNCIAPGAMQTEMLHEIVKKGEILAGKHEFDNAKNLIERGGSSMDKVANLALFLSSSMSNGITGKLISAVWDPWESLPEHLEDLDRTDIYTLRRIVPRDRGKNWGNDT